MILYDYAAICVLAVFAGVGALIGFGRQLKILSKGIIGIATAAAVCYCLSGMIFGIPWVQAFMEKISVSIGATDNAFAKFLLTIRIEKIIVIAITFFAALLIIKVISRTVAKIAEADNVVIRVTDKTLGALWGGFVALLLSLVALSVLYIVKGEEISSVFEGSFFGIDRLFTDNPIRAFIR